MTRILALLLICFTASVGCNQANNAEFVQEKARADAAEAKVQATNAELAKTKERANAAEAELAKLKAVQAQPKAVDADRRAAEWVLRSGGSISAIVDGTLLTIAAGESLSDKPLKLVGVNFDRQGEVLDEGLEYLENLPGLESVNLTAQANVTSLKHFTGNPRLRELFLRHTGVTDAGLEPIKSLPQLELLAIGDTQVTDAGLEHLKGMNKLKVLDLAACKNLTEGGLAHLPGLSNLETLHLTGLPITDKGLEQLKDIKSLKAVEANGTKVTDEGVKSLQTALPNCQVNR